MKGNNSAYYLRIIVICSCLKLNIGHLKTETKCSAEDEVCEFELRISNSWTMMHFSDLMLPVVIDDNGTFFARSKSCDELIPLTDDEISQVIIGDGTYKPVLVFNKKLPGPAIVVYEGQQVMVRVTNELVGTVTTVHWHGQTMEGTPFMDGVAGVSQCPIHPGETFTYRFMASKVGTHWYHTHLGTQRSMGAYGPLVVLPKPAKDQPKTQGGGASEYADDFIMMVSDWMHEDTETITTRLEHDNLMYAYGFDTDKCYSMSRQADGLEMGVVPFMSGVVNGKGRHYPEADKEAVNAGIPLETFTIKRDPLSRVRFRMVSASMLYGMRVSIDAHDLHVIATDGHEVEPLTVQAIIIQPGERYDFWIEARDPTLAGKYWIRVTTLEEERDGKKIHAGHTEAVLHYVEEEDTDEPVAVIGDPVSRETPCSALQPCLVLNCPYQLLAPAHHTKCVDITHLRSTLSQPLLTPTHQQDLQEIFLNFHFAGMNTVKMFRPNINGKVFLPADRPLQMQSELNEAEVTACDRETCTEDVCYCTHQLDIPLNKVIQMVIFTAMPQLDEARITGTPHPIHIHGHQMEVLKVGYPTYNQTTGKYQQFTSDILCESNNLCNQASWADPSWAHGNVPGMITQGAPRKDTLSIPGGGYVVVRFRSDNPGFWIMHCHMEIHNELGMALVMKEGELDDMPRVPPSLTHTCGPTPFPEHEFTALLSGQTHSDTGLQTLQLSLADPRNCQNKELDYNVFLAILVSTDIALLCGLFSLIHRGKKSYQSRTQDEPFGRSLVPNRHHRYPSNTRGDTDETTVLLS